jgi:hypothetical protein
MPVSAPSRLSEIRLPEMPERPKIDLPEVSLPTFEMPDIDVPKALTAAATAVGLVKPQPRRWPYALGAGLLLAGLAVVAVNWSKIRPRLESGAMMAYDRVTAMWSNQSADEPVAFTAAETAPQQPSETTGETGADYPDGLGTNGGSIEDPTASEAYVGV